MDHKNNFKKTLIILKSSSFIVNHLLQPAHNCCSAEEQSAFTQSGKYLWKLGLSLVIPVCQKEMEIGITDLIRWREQRCDLVFQAKGREEHSTKASQSGSNKLIFFFYLKTKQCLFFEQKLKVRRLNCNKKLKLNCKIS